MREMRWEKGGGHYWLAQTVSDPNVWREEEHGELVGLMAIYVDDILACSTEGILRELCKVIQRKWETSVPEFVKTERR